MKLGEKVLGIAGDREFPDFATQTFREWWKARGGAQVQNPDKRVAYFHGCYSNYNTPEVGKAMVRVYEHFGYEVMVPPAEVLGHADVRERDAEGRAPARGDERREPRRGDRRGRRRDRLLYLLFAVAAAGVPRTVRHPRDRRRLRPHLRGARKYLRINEDLEGELADTKKLAGEQSFAYHAPCHARNQGLSRQAVETFRDVDGVTMEDVGDSCSGISGTYGWKEEKYETSMEIGAEMFEHMEDAEGDVGMTECPTCAMQMEHGTGYEVEHPLQLLEDAVGS